MIKVLLGIALLLSTGCMSEYGIIKSVAGRIGGKIGEPRISPSDQPSHVFIVKKSSHTPIAIARKMDINVAGYIYPTDHEYFGAGAVIELFKESVIEKQRYYSARATYYLDGDLYIIKGWINKASIQQRVVTRDIKKIKLTEECPADCIARKNTLVP